MAKLQNPSERTFGVQVVAQTWGITKIAVGLHQSVSKSVSKPKTMFFAQFLGDPWAIIDFLANTDQTIRSDIAYLVQLEESYRMVFLNCR
jgi:hypothetical protein